jgi:lipoprotein NlpI
MSIGNFADVVADLDKIIPQYPDHLLSLLTRAQALALLGRDNEARRAFDTAVRARPDDGMSFSGRGIMRLIAGDLTPAVADLRLASQISPDDSYTAIWHHLAKSKATGDVDKETLERLRRYRTGPWPSPIAAYLLDELSADALLVQAREAKDYQIANNLSDAYYVIGDRMLRTDVSAARQMFERAREAKAYYQYSYLVATRELRRLGGQ